MSTSEKREYLKEMFVYLYDAENLEIMQKALDAMSDEDKKWQRRDDARTLARAEEIKADKERYKGAMLGAKEILEEETKRLNGLTKVAGRRSNSSRKYNESANKAEIPFTRSNNPACLGRFY